MKYTGLLLINLLFCLQLSATHNRAGELTYRFISNLTYEVTITTYTDPGNPQADRDSLELNWGDGFTEFVYRVNGPISPDNGIPLGEQISDGIQKNIYTSVHSYGGLAPFYVVSMEDPNRIADIINIQNSVNQRFYVEDTLFLFPFSGFGQNSSPQLLNPPIDYGNVGELFIHNPGAFDPDGDSLHYSLVVPQQGRSNPVNNYKYPDEIIPGPDNQIGLDPLTGDFVWNAPQQQGVYNIAILIKEYRENFLLGTVVRDMQIIVNDLDNKPPVIVPTQRACVIAGEELLQTIEASDPDIDQEITLEAFGGPIEHPISPAEFIQPSFGNPTSGQLQWQTVCDHIRGDDYQVIFKASDNYRLGNGQLLPLTDLETFEVNVMAPAPQNVAAELNDGVANITWADPYTCADFEDFTGFSVWRRIGSNDFTPDSCETGLAGRGYEQLVKGLQVYSFEDEELIPGQQYCYRVLAHFSKSAPNGNQFNEALSVPSNEACVQLNIDVPLLTRADVLVTDSLNGAIQLAWTNPLVDSNGLDTLQFPGDYVFELYHAEGIGGNNFNLIFSNSVPRVQENTDTTFQLLNVNTEDFGHNFKLIFYSNDGNTIVGESPSSSTQFLTALPSDRQIGLSWNANTSWLDTAYTVYRLDTLTQVFDSIAIVREARYTDQGLQNDLQYCYNIEAHGVYTSLPSLSGINNNSQEICAAPRDTLPPCPPSLSVNNYCDDPDLSNCLSFPETLINELNWSYDLSLACVDDLGFVKIHYAPVLGQPLQQIDSVDATQLAYGHVLSNSIAGVYAISLVDKAGNESELSNTVIKDNCPCYVLPNTFTPNGDGQNDLFTPVKPYLFIESIDITIVNRWGNLIYQTTDPEINWDGTDRNGNPVSPGVYFYHGTLLEQHVEGTRELPLPGSEKGGGFIHLIKD